MTKLQPIDRFVVAIDPKAPPLGFDPHADNWNWQDVLPDNYFNRDNIKAKSEVLGGWPVFTPKRVLLASVPNPEEKKPDLSPKLVLEFEETPMQLVLNKTRCSLAAKLTGTVNPRQWAEKLPQLELYVGVDDDWATSEQVLFRAAPVAPKPGKAVKTVEEINDDLF